MYKKQLLDNLQREILLLKQLTPYIEKQHLDFRPAEKSRSTHELMQYVSGIGSVVIRRYIKNDVTPEMREKFKEYGATLTIENFNDRLDAQWEEIKLYMRDVTEDDLLHKEVELPWKEKMTLGTAIINSPIKWLATYRMQLFLHLKMSGKTELGTKEAWVLQA
jgi:hypothetical protein